MPRVPEVNPDLGSITPPASSGFSATLPMELATRGGRRLQETGEQILQGGQRLAAIELDAVQQANQIRIDDSLNQLKESSLRLQYDTTEGFEQQRGLAALQRPDDQSLAQEYTGRLSTRASEIEASLSNEAQKAAFRRHANNMITGFNGSVQQHETKEFRTYSLSVRDGTIANRMTEIGNNYNNPDVIDEAISSIRAAAYDKARLLGRTGEAEAWGRDAASSAVAVAVKTALEKNDITYADGLLKKYAKDMNPNDTLSVYGQVTREMDTKVGLDTATGVMQEHGPRISTSDSDRAFNIAVGTESNNRQFDKDGKPLTSSAGAIGIAQVMPGTAPEAAKLAGLEWDENKYKNDPVYNRALGKAYFEKQLKDFNGNLAMAYAAYNAGPQRLKDGLKAAEKKAPMIEMQNPDGSYSNVPDMSQVNWLQEMPKETQAYVSKNLKQFDAGGGQFSKPTLSELQNEVRVRLGSGSAQRLKVALDETERQYNSVNAGIKQKNEEAVAEAMRGLIENGGRYAELPANLRSSLAPEDVTKVMDYGKRIYSGDDVTNLKVYNELSTNPNMLRTMTDAQFYMLQSELSTGDFKYFSNERAKLITGRGENGPGDFNSTAINRTLDDRLNSMGIDPKPDAGSKDASRLGAMRQFVNQSIAIEQANRGKKMTDVEVEGFIDTLFAQNSNTMFDSSWWTWRSSINTTIPSETESQLREAFKKVGVENPSESDLLKAYWQHLNISMKQKEKPNG